MTAFVEIVAPVGLLIATGVAAARLGLVSAGSLGDLSRLAFSLFLPALLFRAMAAADLHAIGLRLPGAYFSVVVPLFVVLVVVQRRGGVVAPIAISRSLDAVFSNTVMLGVPLVRLAWGEAGLARLLTIIMFHALILLGMAAVLIEWSAAPSRAGGNAVARLGASMRGAVFNPIVVPIAAGAAWSLAGLSLPASIDRALAMMGSAAAPMCLVLLGASLVSRGERASGPVLLGLCANKALFQPLLVGLVGAGVFGLAGLDLAVLTLAAAMPAGANVFLFAQRYDADPVTAGAVVTVTTLASAATVPALLWWFA